ncbi:Tse2 family ADP-ribosyltransferase toxin [Acidisoma silvae]|uniref:Tse2 ADP-ribosyltransferase toxin domain-containing protein n=1 Tax=Acidisoma silvae TaxID=2802396 RepID=A0A963YP51_9PROT|nr:hypothetical protein [Acidisoma silvae]MCB8874058.1 hypothetical protein [Acidisoma silvae]
MGITTVDLYRLGNNASARLDNVRSQDVTHYQNSGMTWVKAGTGGISTFDKPIHGKGRLWHLPAGHDYGTLLLVWNDHGQHWSWEPTQDMPLDDYKRLLCVSNAAFM